MATLPCIVFSAGDQKFKQEPMGTITHSNHNTLITVLVDACENMVMKKNTNMGEIGRSCIQSYLYLLLSVEDRYKVYYILKIVNDYISDIYISLVDIQLDRKL